jgi:hypothetical protein
MLKSKAFGLLADMGSLGLICQAMWILAYIILYVHNFDYNCNSMVLLMTRTIFIICKTSPQLLLRFSETTSRYGIMNELIPLAS